MKTKTYTFNRIEVLAIRTALLELKHQIPKDANSPVFRQMREAAIRIHKQMSNDITGGKLG